MKNFNKIILLIISFFVINNTYADVLSWPEYGINKTTFTDNFWTSVDITWNQDINIKITTLISDDNKTYLINLPNWFIYNWVYDTSWSNCENIWINLVTNSSFSYSFSGSWICIWEVIFSYKSDENITSWNKNISILDSSTFIWNLWVNVQNSNLLNSINSYDTNKDWFLDKLKLNFSKDITWVFSNSGLTLETITPTLESFTWKTVYLNITDWILDTFSSKTLSDIDWWMFDNIWIISNFPITDNAWAVLLKIGNIDLLSLSEKQIINFSTWWIFKFSEWFVPNSENNFSISNWSWSLSWSFVLENNNKDLRFNFTNTNNVYWNYQLTSSWALDWKWNPAYIDNEKYLLFIPWTRSISCSWLPQNATWHQNEITQTWNSQTFLPTNIWIYSSSSLNNTCAFKCNFWYEWKNNECSKKQSSWGWWWGWFSVIITNPNDTNITVSNIYDYKKFVSSEFKNFILWNNSINKTLATSYIKSINHKWLNKIDTQLSNLIIDYKIDLFTTLDKNFKENNEKLLVNYINFFENINKYLKTKDRNYINTAKTNYNDFLKYSKLTKETYNKYITFWKYKNNEIILSSNLNYQKAFKSLERKIIDKLIILKSKNIIDENEYNNSINNYNDFILYFNIWKKTNKLEYKNKSINAFSELFKTYKKK